MAAQSDAKRDSIGEHHGLKFMTSWLDTPFDVRPLAALTRCRGAK
jgi:hypothetical protein